MATTTFPRLPSDVLQLIFNQFCLHCQDAFSQSWDDRPLRPAQKRLERQIPSHKSWYSIDRHTLCSLSLACRDFRDVAQPILHHEFALGYGSSWESMEYKWDGRLASFIRTLARRPDLARLVRVIYIHTRLFRFNTDATRATNRAVVREAAQALGIDLPAAWKRRLSTISDDESQDSPEIYRTFLGSYLDDKPDLTAKQERDLHEAMTVLPLPGWRWMNAEMIATLIAQTPYLQYLSLQGGREWPTCGLPESSLRALGISNLPSLKTLDLGVGASIIGLAPRLETLNLLQHSYLGPSTPNMPNLKTLRLTDALMTPRELQRLLSACTGGLEAFEYEVVGEGFDYEALDDDDAPPCTQFQVADAINILRIHKNTLRVLHIHFYDQGFVMNRIPGDTNLREFTALQHIFINSPPLFGFGLPVGEKFDDHEILIRFLPPSIVSLAICTNQHCTFNKKALVNLANWKIKNPSDFPFLKWINCSSKIKSSSLTSLFETSGVELSNQLRTFSGLKPYLNGPNESSRLQFSNRDSGDEL
ncbi:hypothetical protein NW762_008003 [Fusarium torreyae]|uniref:F-box domain-containing protein n=1 Tax=Fusarium torreyae TaxID=1237075 RepID=A0A9W8RYB2_9HYPO|nr:hypothetical protein NW762_008003 [Fusarium torreyae]